MIVLIFIVSLMSSWYPSDSISFKVPLDHFLANGQKISIWCDLRAPLDPDKDTILLLEDPLDQVFDNIELAEHIPDNFNLVTIKGRFQSPELNKFLNINTSIDFKRTYELLGQRQIAKDIEFIRKELLGEQKVILLGYSSSAAFYQYFVSAFPDKVSSIISINPLVFDIQKNFGFPSQSANDLPFEINDARFVDFSYYSSYTPIRNSAHELEFFNQVHEYFAYRPLLQGADNLKELSLALQCRLFEFSMAYSGMQQKLKLSTPLFKWMRSGSEGFWEAYSAQPFPFYGVNYDELLTYQGNSILITAAFDHLIYSQAYEGLAEFYRNTTLLQLRDGHAMIKSKLVFDELLGAFLNDDFEAKVEVYEELKKMGLVYQESENQKYPIPPLF